MDNDLSATMRDYASEPWKYDGGSWPDKMMAGAAELDRLSAENAALSAQLADALQCASVEAGLRREFQARAKQAEAALAAAKVTIDKHFAALAEVLIQRDEANARIAELEARVVTQANEWRIAYNELSQRAEAECVALREALEFISDKITGEHTAWVCAKARAALQQTSPAAISDPTFERDLVEIRAIDRMRAERDALREALEEWEQCARYDTLMEGPRFKGWDRSQMERCRKRMEAARAAAPVVSRHNVDPSYGSEVAHGQLSAQCSTKSP